MLIKYNNAFVHIVKTNNEIIIRIKNEKNSNIQNKIKIVQNCPE